MVESQRMRHGREKKRKMARRKPWLTEGSEGYEKLFEIH
jgi:hypothetical protein